VAGDARQERHLEALPQAVSPAGQRLDRQARQGNVQGDLKLANKIETQGKRRFARNSPYIVDPSLHALNQKRFAKKFSYPSKHSVLSAALSRVLGHYEPHRRGEYRWMTDEVSFSRLYAGGHYPSDIAAGAYLGDLVGLYELALTPPAGRSG